MGVRDIGFSSVKDNTLHRADEQIRYESEREGTYLVWTTDAGTGTHQSFTIAISWAGIPKGQTVMSAQSETITKTIPIEQLNEHTSENASGTYWAVGLSQFDDLLSKLGSWTGDDIGFLGRKYDYITFDVSICANYADPSLWGANSSPYENAKLSLVFVPSYNITDVYYDTPDMIVVEYTAEDWSRFDDRWALHRCKLYDGTSFFLNSNSIIAGNTYGTVSKSGRIEIPATAFTVSILNKKIRLMIRWVASYLPVGYGFADDTVEITVDSKIIKNTPTLAVAANDNRTLELNVGDSGDMDAEIDTVTVKMEGGGYTLDTVTVTKEGSTWPQATFRYCPYNTPLTFTAIGSKGQGASAPKSLSNVVLKNRNRYSFDTLSDEISVDLNQDINFSVSSSSNHSTVQFAGRRRPSAFYGTGGTATISVSATLLFDDADKFISLAQSDSNGAGDVMVRLPDGKRYVMAVDSCDVDWTNRNQKNVSISGVEVDA